MRRRAVAGALMAIVAATTAVEAHQLIPGVTGVPGAALHTLTAADQVMALVAAGLLVGSGGWRGFLAGLAGLAFGFAGGFADMVLGPAIPFAWLGALTMALLVALATAFNLKPGVTTAFLATAVTGAFIGNSAIPNGESWSALATTGGGTLIGIAVIAAIPGAISALVRTGWPRVLIRVAASWIAASSLMVLAFALAPLVRG